MLEISNEIYILIWFGSWVLVWILLTIWYAKYIVKKTEIFAVVFASLWVITIIMQIETSQYFDILGLMSWMHLVGEKTVKTFIDLILQLKWHKKLEK